MSRQRPAEQQLAVQLAGWLTRPCLTGAGITMTSRATAAWIMGVKHTARRTAADWQAVWSAGKTGAGQVSAWQSSGWLKHGFHDRSHQGSAWQDRSKQDRQGHCWLDDMSQDNGHHNRGSLNRSPPQAGQCQAEQQLGGQWVSSWEPAAIGKTRARGTVPGKE